MTLSHYAHRQAVVAAVVNALLNPLLAWATNPGGSSLPLLGPRSVAVDLVVTSLVLSVLVAWFAAHGLRDDLARHRVERGPNGTSRRPRHLAASDHLSGRAMLLGLVLGAAAALVVLAVVAVLGAAGGTAVAFPAYLALKAGYTGALGYLVMHRVILHGAAVFPEAASA